MRLQKSRRVSSGLTTFALIAMSMTYAAPASATITDCGNLTDGHCYARGLSNDQYNMSMSQMYAQLRVQCLAVRDPRSEFATWEMWMLTGNGTSNWIETGFTAGPIFGTSLYGYKYFWADSRPNGTYNEHLLSGDPNPSVNTFVTFAIKRVSGGTWDILRDGSWAGQSTGSGTVGTGGALGNEVAVSTGPAVYADAAHWQFVYNVPGAWHVVPANFGKEKDAGQYGYVGSSAGTTVNVTTPNYQCGSQPLVVAAKTTATAALPTDAVEKAANVSKTWGESSPSLGNPTLTTRAKALNLMAGESVDGPDEPVFVVRATGAFEQVKGPHGNKKVSGKTMYVIVSQATGDVTDVSVMPSSTDIDLAG